jgi:hypothetical protein
MCKQGCRRYLYSLLKYSYQIYITEEGALATLVLAVKFCPGLYVTANTNITKVKHI